MRLAAARARPAATDRDEESAPNLVKSELDGGLRYIMGLVFKWPVWKSKLETRNYRSTPDPSSRPYSVQPSADGLRHVDSLPMSPPQTSGWDPVLLISQVNALE